MTGTDMSMPSAGKPRGDATSNKRTPRKRLKMTKINVKPATADKRDWNKYMEELRKETVECIVENHVP